jgi:hypothetical protein
MLRKTNSTSNTNKRSFSPTSIKKRPIHPAAKGAYNCWINYIERAGQLRGSVALLENWNSLQSLHLFKNKSSNSGFIVAGFDALVIPGDTVHIVWREKLTDIEIENLAWADVLTIILKARGNKFEWERLRQLLNSEMPKSVKKALFGKAWVSRSILASLAGVKERSLRSAAEQYPNNKIGG